jgi:hypothetical protein
MKIRILMLKLLWSLVLLLIIVAGHEKAMWKGSWLQREHFLQKKKCPTLGSLGKVSCTFRWC